MGRLPPAPMLARVLLLSLAAGAVLLAWLPPPAAPLESGQFKYLCPMHPLAISPAPGTCPVCGMELVLDSGSGPPVRPSDVEGLHPRILQMQPRAWAWVEDDRRIIGLLFLDEVGVVPLGAEGVFHAPGLPTVGIPVRRTEGVAVPRDGSTSELEFRVTAGRGNPSPGTVGWIEIPVRSAPALVVPSSAVLQSPEGPAVLVQLGEGSRLSRRQVTVGRSRVGMTVIVSGISAADRVVTRGAAFLDREQTLVPPARP